MRGYPVASDVSIVTACSQAPTQKAKLLTAATWPATHPDRCPAICYHRESTKSKKYAANCHRNEWTFQPLVFSDISGAPGPATLRHVQAMAKSCRDSCDPWMFWIRFRQISAAVSIGTFHLARSIRAEMLSKDRQNGPKRTAKENRRALRQPEPSECTGNANSRSLDCPEQYRTRGSLMFPARSTRSSSTIASARRPRSSSPRPRRLPLACRPSPARSALLPMFAQHATQRSWLPSPLLLCRLAHSLWSRRSPLLLFHPSCRLRLSS
jgi:hypothetical protein